MRTIRELIWHTSATPQGREHTVEDIDVWHKKRGWNGIGYHKVVYLDGSVHNGRSESVMGAHVKGHNKGTIGYCYIGGVSATDFKKAKDTRTAAQKKTMHRITKEAIAKYNLKRVTGHHDYANRACPCFPAKAEYAHLLKPTGAKKPLPKSRTVQGATVAGGTGIASITEGLSGVVTAAGDAQYQLTSGQTIQIIIGVIAVAGAAYVLYSRWDDAGRPSIREIIRSVKGD